MVLVGGYFFISGLVMVVVIVVMFDLVLVHVIVVLVWFEVDGCVL